MMPEMTGPELVREMAVHYPHVSVLLVTGYVGDAGDTEDLAGYEMLRKPFTLTGLSSAVGTLLSRRISGSPADATSEAAE
jgi:DNA-binding NtrC family response regulator